MVAEQLQSKLTYRTKSKLEVFYTGGAAAVTKDGKFVACACADEIKVVELESGAVVRTLPGDSEPITALAVSPDSKTLISSSRSLVCKAWDMHTGEVQRTWKAHKAPVADMAVDSSGGYVATASADKSVRVHDVQGGFCTHKFVGHSGVVLKVLFHPKQLLLFSAGDDAEVRVWDLVTKECVAVLKGHFSSVTSLALSPDGWLLLSGGRDKVVHVWDLRSNSKVATVPVFEAVEGVVSLPPGSAFPGVPAAATTAIGPKRPVYFATAGEKGMVKIWRSDTASCVYQPPAALAAITGGTSSEATDLKLMPGGHQLLLATSDCRLLLLGPAGANSAEPTAGAAGQQLQVVKQLIGNNDEVTDLKLLGPADAPTHIAVATNSEVIRVFELGSMSCAASLAGHKDIVLCLDHALLPAQGSAAPQEVLVSGAKDNEVRVWHVATGACLAIGQGHLGSVSSVAVAPKSKKLLVSAAADKLLKLWDLAPVAAAAAAAAAAAEAGSAPAAPLQLRAIAATAAHDKDINSVAISPNDSLVASASQDRTVRLWQLPNLVPTLTFRGHKRGVWALAFSPVDQALLSASGDRTLKLWSLQDGSCLKTFEGHTGSVLRACFATAGTQVISAGSDGLVKLWNIRTSECISTFDEHEDKVWALALGGPGEKVMATGGGDAVVAVWEDVTEADQAAAQEQEEELLQKEQALQNALVDEDFAAAARLAFDLKHPGRLLSVINKASAQGARAGELLQSLAAHMSPEDLKAALEYIREWNTNARHCHAAHAMLRALLQQHAPSALLAVPGAGELLEALAAYSSRHLGRVERLLRSSFLLDATLASMQVLMPTSAEAGDAADEAAVSSDDEEVMGIALPAGGVIRAVQVVDDDYDSELDEAEEEGAAAAAAAAGGEGQQGGSSDGGEEEGLANGHVSAGEDSDEEMEAAGNGVHAAAGLANGVAGGSISSGEEEESSDDDDEEDEEEEDVEGGEEELSLEEGSSEEEEEEQDEEEGSDAEDDSESDEQPASPPASKQHAAARNGKQQQQQQQQSGRKQQQQQAKQQQQRQAVTQQQQVTPGSKRPRQALTATPASGGRGAAGRPRGQQQQTPRTAPPAAKPAATPAAAKARTSVKKPRKA